VIKHVVLWRLKSDNGDIFHTVRAALEAQQGKIPGLLRVEVGRNFATARRAVHFALVCEFDSRDSLNAYHRHPVHMQTRAVVDPLVEEHWIVDYEV
jgi:hypothetical protein